jgi:hypothetical protein
MDQTDQKKKFFYVETNVESINNLSPNEKDASPAKDKIIKMITKKQTPILAKQFISKNILFLGEKKFYGLFFICFEESFK